VATKVWKHAGHGAGGCLERHSNCESRRLITLDGERDELLLGFRQRDMEAPLTRPGTLEQVLQR